MSKQYIIKNCPNFDDTNYLFSCNAKGILNCQDCTVCLLKQIVDICKDSMDVEKNLSPKCGVYYFAKRILCFLDIEEVE